jgi:hypothetical protein
MICPRCGAPTTGVHCSSCGETLAFAPPAAGETDLPLPADRAAEGAGWLIAAGIIQIVLGALWVVVGLVGVAAGGAAITQQLTARLGDATQLMSIVWAVFILACVGGILTIVVSAFLVTRRSWAWIVSLVFDIGWALLALLSTLNAPQSGIPALFVSGMLIACLVVGRRALR